MPVQGSNSNKYFNKIEGGDIIIICQSSAIIVIFLRHLFSHVKIEHQVYGMVQVDVSVSPCSMLACFVLYRVPVRGAVLVACTCTVNEYKIKQIGTWYCTLSSSLE